MKFDPERNTLEFGSAEDLQAFHRELTVLLRELTVQVSGSTEDSEVARDRAREVLREFKMVTRVLNALRRGGTIPRTGE